MDSLAESIRDTLDWDMMITRHGNTQETERYYIGVICNVLKKQGYTITGQASSQSSVDIKTDMGNFECKKKNTKNGAFMLNDTLPKQNVHYIFMITDIKTVIIKNGEDLIRFTGTESSNKTAALTLCTTIMNYLENKATIHDVVDNFFEFIKVSVFCGKMSLYDFGNMFKRTTVFGNLKSRPRPNWSISL